MGKFNFNLDNKVTAWYRTSFEVEAETEEKAKAKAIKMCKKMETDEMPWNLIDDTIEVMSIKENDGFSTMELSLGEVIIWQDGL